MSSRILSVLSFPRLKKTFASSLAVLLMTAVPAFGIVYTGNWVVKRNKQTNGAPKAVIDTSSPSQLIVNMGVNNKKHSTSTVVVRRTFESFGELVTLSNMFGTLIQDGFVEVFARVIPQRGADSFNQRFFQNVSGTQLIGDNQVTQRFLRAGKYTLEVTIRYVNRKGFWDNNISPHKFTLTAP
jgi:hypothetical protein